MGAMRIMVMVLAAGLLAGCQKTAEVKCTVTAAGGFSCEVKNTSATSAEVCWATRVSCTNGSRPWARACQAVAAGGQTVRVIAPADVWDAAKCDQLVGMSVDEVTVK